MSKTTKIIKIIFLSITGYGIVEHLWGLDAVGLINSLSYFTMLSNIYCFIALFLSLAKSNNYGDKYKGFYGGALMSITLTFFIYNFVLANSDFTMRAMRKVTFDENDIFVHYVVPVIMWLDFIFFMPHRTFKIEYITKWLLIPVAYFILIMSKAMYLTSTGASKIYKRYPYDFLDFEENGIPYLVSFIGLFVLICIVIGCIICVLDFVLGMFYTKRQCEKKENIH